MRVITAADIHGDRIDELTTWLPAALRGEVRIDPSAYVRFSYDLKGGASDNWDEVFIACELINLLYGYVTVYSEGEIIGWICNKLLPSSTSTSAARSPRSARSRTPCARRRGSTPRCASSAPTSRISTWAEASASTTTVRRPRRTPP